MNNRGLLDDVNVYWTKSGTGPAVLFPNHEIRRMLKLARAREGDVFLDLGCGWAQHLIIALTEFNVSKAIGYEENQSRHRKASSRMKMWSQARGDISPDRWAIVGENFDKILDGRSKRASLKEATIIFYGLSTYPELIESIEKGWKDSIGNRRLLYYRNCVFPEILPDESDLPFYVSRYPFRKTTNRIEWLKRVVGKENSSMKMNSPVEEGELWDELRHDYRVEGDWKEVKEYQRRLRKIPV